MIETPYFNGDFIFPGLFLILLAIAVIIVIIAVVTEEAFGVLMVLAAIAFVSAFVFPAIHTVNIENKMVSDLGVAGYHQVSLEDNQQFYAQHDGKTNKYVLVNTIGNEYKISKID